MARTYKRDGIGRFAGGGGSSGGGGGKRPAAKSVSRGVNRLTRDNAGKITSVGGEGATARGGRLKTAAGNKRAMQTAKVSGGRPAGTMKGRIKRDPGAAGKVGQRKAAAATAAKKRIALPSLKTNTDLGRRGVVSLSARAKVTRSQNVKSLATEKGKGVLERIQGAGARRGSRETKYNAPGSAGANRIAKTAATQSSARAFAQQQVYNKGGGAYRGQRPEFDWKRSRATAKPAAAASNSGARDTARNIRDTANKQASNAAASQPSTPKLATKAAGAKAPDNARTRANRLRTTQNLVKFRRVDSDSKSFSDAVKSRNSALAARTKGTGERINFRSKGQAVSRQNYRANEVTGRVKQNMRMFGAKPGNFSKQTGAANSTAMKRTDTGMRQPSLFGPATKLYSTKTVKVKRKSGKRKP
jgi:hypothetical protein